MYKLVVTSLDTDMPIAVILDSESNVDPLLFKYPSSAMHKARELMEANPSKYEGYNIEIKKY